MFVKLCLILVAFVAPHLTSCVEKPDGKIFFLSGGNLASIRPDGTDRTLIIEGILDRQVAVSPDGTRIAYLHVSDGTKSLSMLDTISGQTVHIFSPRGGVSGLEWSRRGDYLAGLVHDSNGTRLLIAGKDGSREQLINLDGTTSIHRPTVHWHPNGSEILYSDGEIRLLDLKTHREMTLGLGFDARYDSKGRVVLFVDRARGYLHDRDPTGGWYVGILEPGTSERRLRGAFSDTGIPENYRAPVWSPGGDQIAMMLASIGTFDVHEPVQVLYVVNRDGSTATTVGTVYPGVVLDDDASQSNWLFSTDGRYLVCALYTSGESSQLAVIDLVNGRETVIDERQWDNALWLDQVHFIIAWSEE